MISDSLIVAVYSFGRSVIGIILRPYETYRRIVDKSTLWELVPLGLVLSCYFAVASLVKTAAFRPFLLTKQFLFLWGTACIGYVLITGTLYISSRLFGGKGMISHFFIGWAYTLIPTVSWFFMTSLLYVILPPPRTTHTAGVLFSVCYLTISSVLLFWKIILSYLTLRFAMKLDLLRILGVVAIAGPVIALFSISMYKLGVFRVPFI